MGRYDRSQHHARSGTEDLGHRQSGRAGCGRGATAQPDRPDVFFQRVELLAADGDGDEILPVTYDDNYVTVFPGEQVDIRGRVPPGGPPPALVRVSGYNSWPVVTAVR